MVDPVVRERSVITLLEEWPWELGATLIGGYATAAYGPPRYSDDVDFLIPDTAREALETWLREQGFENAKGEKAKTTQVFEDAPRFARDEVTLDLLVGYVRDREAKVKIPESWVSLRRHHERLDLISGRLDRRIPIARPEALWALKLQAGRDQDLTDLFAISKVAVNSQEVRSLFQNLMVPTLEQKLKKVELKLADKKLYDDSRSRMSLKDGKDVMARWKEFRERVSSMIPHEERAEPGS